ncbi:MAG: Ig-like domain-containing protein [Ruminococcus sp.]|nr:Ig-like domain-containing protein [Ruminococcus sp.]
MKLFKRTLSLVLAVLMLASLATIMASAVSKAAPREGTITYIQRDADGNPVIDPGTGKEVEIETTLKYGTRPVITEVVNKDPDTGTDIKTRKYRFYLPDAWCNDRNDNYDGTSLDSCAAGIYWWGTTYNSDDFKNGIANPDGTTEYDNVQGWPGYRVLEQDPDDPHIFVCEVPEDCGTIIFNNLVDGGTTPVDNPGYGFNYQTVNISTSYTDPEDDEYRFYTTTKDGQPITPENPMTFDDMIFVVDPKNTSINDYSGVATTGGDWFYYYGDGKYGVTPEQGDEVYANGDFKSSLQISDTNIFNYLNDGPYYEVFCSADPTYLTVTSEDESIATVSAPEAVTAADGVASMYKSKVTVTGLAEGETNVKFIEKDSEGKELGSRTLAVTNMYIDPMVEVSNKSVSIGKTVKLNASIMFAESVSYKSSNTKIATVTNAGVVKGIAAGTATITITAKAGSTTVTAKAKVTVKKLANTMTVKASAKTVKFSKVKKKAQTVSAIKVSKAQGKVTYTKKSGKFAVNKSNGKITVKKGTKKGKYSVKVAVKAAGNAKYNASTKTVTVKITVK